MPLSTADQQRLVALYPFILGYSMQIARNRELAEDIAQDVCCKFLAATHHYRDTGELKGYLAFAIRNRFIDYCRKAKRCPEFQAEHGDLAELSPAADNQHSRLELLDTLDALDQLPAVQAKAVLYSACGATIDTIAARLDCEVGTAKSRIWRGRATLREMA